MMNKRCVYLSDKQRHNVYTLGLSGIESFQLRRTTNIALMPNVTACHYSSVALTVLLLGLLLLLLLLSALLSVASLAACSKH